jgi:hypothetical protein
MMSKLQQAFSQLDLSKKDIDNLIPGILGFTINGQQIVEVPGRNGYVYVRLRDNLNEVVQAYNDAISPVYNLAVLLYRDEVDKTRFRIQSRDVGRYQNWGSFSSYLPRHGTQHSFVPDASGGGDITWVYGNQFMPMLGLPSGSNGSMNVVVYEYPHYYNGSWQAAGNTGTSSFVGYKPTDTTARMMLVYMDAYGNPNIRAGSTYFASTITGTSAVMPYMPGLLPNEFPVCGVRLVSGTNKILWNNIYDVRDHYGGQISNFYAKNDETFLVVTGSSNLSNERILTAGNNISFVDNGPGGTFVINGAAGGGGGGSTLLIYDDGVFKVTGTALDFDSNLSVSVVGTTAHISSVGGGIPLLIYDNGVFRATGTSIDFGDNLDVAVTGSSVFVNASGGGIGGGSTLPIYNNSIFKTTGSAISFDNSLDVAVTGSIAYVSSSFSVKAHSIAGILVTGSVTTPYPLNSDDWDDGDMHSTSTGTSQLTCRRAGKYHATAYLQFIGGGKAGGRFLSIHKNGISSGYLSSKQVAVSEYTSETVELNCSTDVNLGVGDYVEMVASHSATGTLNCAPGYFSMFLT